MRLLCRLETEFPPESVGCGVFRNRRSISCPGRACLFTEKLESKGVADGMQLRIELRKDRRITHIYLARKDVPLAGRAGKGLAVACQGAESPSDCRCRDFATTMIPLDT